MPRDCGRNARVFGSEGRQLCRFERDWPNSSIRVQSPRKYAMHIDVRIDELFGTETRQLLPYPELRESAMTPYQIRIVATLVSVTLSAPIFERDVQRHPYQDRGLLGRTLLSVGQTKIDRPSWCLRDYAADSVDCSFSDRAQCAATASGGLGDCVPNSSAR
jgi:Protein of unknown function (DUF3551)